MAFSIVGWVAAAFRLRYSWGSLALSSALAWPTPSSNAALVALKYSADTRSKAANCVWARPRTASMPALFVLAICSGVKFMIISVIKTALGWNTCRYQLLSSALVLWCVGAAENILHCNNRDFTRKTIDVKDNLCDAITLTGRDDKSPYKQSITSGPALWKSVDTYIQLFVFK